MLIGGSLADPQPMRGIRRGAWLLRLQRQHLMTLILKRAGYIGERLAALKTDFGNFTRRHSLDKQFCSDKSERTYFLSYIQKIFFQIYT